MLPKSCEDYGCFSSKNDSEKQPANLFQILPEPMQKALFHFAQERDQGISLEKAVMTEYDVHSMGLPPHATFVLENAGYVLRVAPMKWQLRPEGIDAVTAMYPAK